MNNVREAIKIVKDLIPNTMGLQAYQIEALATLLSLAQSVLDAKMPKEKPRFQLKNSLKPSATYLEGSKMNTTTNDFLIKGKCQEEWISWLNKELELPIKVEGLMVDVLIIFRELLTAYDIWDDNAIKIYDLCKNKKHLFPEEIYVRGKKYKGVYSFIADAYIDAFDKIKRLRSPQ